MTTVEPTHGSSRPEPVASLSPRNPYQLLGLGAIVVLVAAVGGYLFWRASSGVSDTACQDVPAHRLLPDYVLLAWSVGWVALGRWLGPQLLSVPEDERGEQAADTVGIMTAMLFFAAVTFALLYEGIGVQASLDQGLPVGRFHQLEPITYYVRCAIFYDKSSTGGLGYGTYAIFALSAFLAGHWLWPFKPPQRDPDVDDKGKVGRKPGQFVWPTLLTLVSVVSMIGAGIEFITYALRSNPNTVAVVEHAAPADVVNRVAQGEGTFHTGVLIVIAFVTIFFLCIACLDLFFAWKKWDSIGLRVQPWAQANAWFAFGLLAVLGALVAHFGGNEIQYS